MFEDVIELWIEYSIRDVGDDKPQLHLAGEVESRLHQLDLILEHLQRALWYLNAVEPGDPTFAAWDQVVLFTESFYFIAWRIREVVHRTGTYALPGMKGVDFDGVKRFRNLLIEHPEKVKTAPKIVRHFALGDDGPVLKPDGLVAGEAGFDEPKGADHGLFVNAREIRDRLAERLDLLRRERDENATPASGDGDDAV
jgi:hypothetical protein